MPQSGSHTPIKIDSRQLVSNLTPASFRNRYSRQSYAEMEVASLVCAILQFRSVEVSTVALAVSGGERTRAIRRITTVLHTGVAGCREPSSAPSASGDMRAWLRYLTLMSESVTLVSPNSACCMGQPVQARQHFRRCARSRAR
jgi:hypothetical protein